MLSGVCPLPSSHMVERFGRWLFMFLYEKTTKLCHSWSIKTHFYCYRRTVAPDFLGGGFEVDLSRRRVSDRKMGTSSDLWHTRETQEVVGGGGAEGRGGNYNQANSTLILPCILSLSLSVKSRVVPGCQNCRRIYTNFFSLIIDLIYFTIHSLGFRFYVNVTMIVFFFFFSF